MTRLGTYTTLDYPLKSGDTMGTRYGAIEDWLRAEALKIGAVARVLMNQHDFGSYPSFEIDHDEYAILYPMEMMDEIENEDQEKLDAIRDKINDLEQRYYEKYGEWL